VPGAKPDAADNVTEIHPRRVDGAAVEALHDTLRLVHDLAEALAAQTSRARRQVEDLGSPAPTADLVGRLSQETQRVRRYCEELTTALSTIDGTETGEPAPRPEPVDPAAARRRATPRRRRGGANTSGFARRSGDPAETLAIDLKLEGMPPADVEAFLTETFSIDNASEIVGRVFGTKS
jgi:hypothetical protein